MPRSSLGLLIASVALISLTPALPAGYIWVEAEKPVQSTMKRHPWWYDKVKKDQLSGGDFLSHWDADRPGEADYEFRAPRAGDYEFWVRANPVQAKLSYRLNAGDWKEIDLEKESVGTVNVAADGAIDLRFLTWVRVGTVHLRAGKNSVRFRMDSKNNHHGYLDCFVFSEEVFRPQGILKPEEIAKLSREAAAGQKDWVPFDPPPDRFSAKSGIDLRLLNEKEAGAGGFIAVRNGHFIHSDTGDPVRFWGVNGPSSKDAGGLRREARTLAKYGVNLVRIHGGYFDEKGDVNPARIRHAHEVIEALKAEGIYSHFSIYFPLWLRPAADTPWLKGYDGKKNPFAALFFNPDFQQKYRGWWKALLLTPSPRTGKRLIDEPAIAGVEIINEDSYFFWTFNPDAVPDAELRILEKQFGDWAQRKYGSLDEAVKKGDSVKTPRDDIGDGRLGFRPLWNMFNERTPRDRDTARFLAEAQRKFYQDTVRFLRDLGFRGVITASNWTTASPQYLGPLEKYTYTAGDFLDRHGYFGCHCDGDGWSLRESNAYADRSALRFDSEEPGKPRSFVHPAFDVHYDGKPSMISETTFNRPNRYRSEAPLFFAAYGALQDSDAIVHFAQDSAHWSVKPGFFMQPWTLMSPAMEGQFPAAALLYRKGLVATGDRLVELDLKIDDLMDLKGTPLPQEAALDELHQKDVPQGTTLRPGQMIDPLVHLVGRTDVRFTEQGGPARLAGLSKYIDHRRRTVTSSTGQLRLDYDNGVLIIDAPAAQGVSGNLKKAGAVDLHDVSISSPLELGHVLAITLDDRPLKTSRKILLQAMSEEKGTDFRAEPSRYGLKRITSLGHDPWLVHKLAGTVRLRRADAGQLTVTALDGNGEPVKEVGSAAEITLRPDTLYYLITP